MTEQADINFGQFVVLVQQERRRNENVSIERAVDLTFASNYRDPFSGVLELDRAPDSDLENRVIRAIFLREETPMLVILESVDAARVPELLDPILQNLEDLMITGMPMTEAQANVIFGRMHNSNLRDFTVYLRRDYGQGFVRALVGFLQNSPLVGTLSLVTRYDDDDDWIMTEENFQSLCAGISSSSVNMIIIDSLRVRGHRTDRIHEILAELIGNSTSSIERIEVEPAGDFTFSRGDFSIQLLSRTLFRTPAIRNLDISFRTTYDDEDGRCDSLILTRNPWWKRHLADMDTVPTKLLPSILEKADRWECDSHSHLDVLFYLVKEKNPLLLQNVRRRRIRKRKRYGFDA